MSLEMRGFYSELLDAIWDAQGPVPSDPRKLAMMVCCNVRTVRKLLPQLLALGKVVETAGGLMNNRMASDIRKPNSASTRSEFDLNSRPIRPEFEAKNPKNPMFSTRDLEGEEERREEEEKKERKSHQPTEQVAEGLCEVDSVSRLVLEDALQQMVADAQSWIGNGATQAGARKWLSAMCLTTSKAAVAKSYQWTLKGMASGAVRDPANYWAATAERFQRGVNVPLPKGRLTAREALAQLEAENA